MPMYEFEPCAQGAGNLCCYFETLQGLQETPLTQCPTCGTPVKKKWSVFSSSFLNEIPKNQNIIKDRAPKEALKIQTELSPAQRVSKLAMGHVCHANCKH